MTRVLMRHTGETVLWRQNRKLELRSHKPRNAWRDHKPEEARNELSPRTPTKAGSQPCWHLDLTLSAQLCERIHFCVCVCMCFFKLPSLRSFVQAALESYYKGSSLIFPLSSHCFPFVITAYSGGEAQRLLLQGRPINCSTYVGGSWRW